MNSDANPVRLSNTSTLVSTNVEGYDS